MTPGAVIVGAGEAGVAAAFALREAGFGGAVTLIGGEAELPYERPPLSKQVLDGADLKPIRIEADYAAAGITLLRGRTISRLRPDLREVEFSNGDGLGYEALLLATGAAPRQLKVPGAEHRAVHMLRHAADALALRAKLAPGMRVAIIGGGLIGLEVAAAASSKGAAVTVVEAGARVLARGVPLKMAEILALTHRNNGVRFITNANVVEIVWREGIADLRLADGGGFAADLVVVAIGVAPKTALADEAGLTIDNGVATDSFLRTSQAAVFAAGDCCSFPHALFGNRRLRLESWQSAQELGRLAGKNMAGVGQAVAHVPWMWSDQYHLGLQVTGLPGVGATTVTRRDGAARMLQFNLGADGRLVGASGLGHGTDVARDIKIAQRLIATRAAPDPHYLADRMAPLKALLAKFTPAN